MLIEVEFSKSAAYNACFTAAECLSGEQEWSELLFGDAAHHRQALADQIGL